ncbi:MAG: hypothetical protein HYV04_20235 [Deltaproteobacteria bacterium]|nr:hypothetical protein [Deltaproteobacteria bacterium]
MDSLGPQGARFWIRLDGKKRPQRIYVGEGFYEADRESQKWFVEIFSKYLAGHPERGMILDLFDAGTGMLVGEYGWEGFKLFADGVRAMERVRRKSGR